MVGDLIGRTIEVTVHRSGRSFTAELTPVELDV
jgi:hypothetical protein